jgi:hypothetical protein
MNEASRRDVLRTVLLAGAATAAVGLVIVPDTAEAVVVVGPHRPIVGGPHRLRRRWVCWWSPRLRRRVCDWRWV